MPTERALTVLLLALLGTVVAVAPLRAQGQWGTSTPPAWGQLGPPAWGQYQGTIGGSGWQYNKTLQPNVPQGVVQSPNQIGGGPGTGAIFTSPDTRLLGRNGQ